MFIEKVKSEGLAHLSYVLGDADEAAVIDPRRDCDVYMKEAAKRGCRISHIFETHRNEDLISGAPILAELTGASVHHGPNAAGNVVYAQTVREGEKFKLGDMVIKVLETPGHTDDSLSFVVYDSSFGDQALGVFSGDALFVGDVGRTDFYPDRAEEVAGLLFDSLKKICALGDQTILFPAHGAGSVCGNNMADREFSTIGYERLNNPMLQTAQRDAFIAKKMAEQHELPPYFRLMERLNLEGANPVTPSPVPTALGAKEFAHISQDSVIVDVRGTSDFLGAHVPDSLAIPVDMVPAFAGWLLDPDSDFVLVANDEAQASTAARYLARIGYDRVQGFLATDLTSWATEARPFRSVPIVNVNEVARRVTDASSDWVLLDVRSETEVSEEKIEGALPVYVGELPGRMDSLKSFNSITVVCESGARATIAASVLLRAGHSNVDVFLGSMGAWETAGYDTSRAS